MKMKCHANVKQHTDTHTHTHTHTHRHCGLFVQCRFGIKYSTAVDPGSQSCTNLSFLEVMAEFGHKLLDVDKSGEKGV